MQDKMRITKIVYSLGSVFATITSETIMALYAFWQPYLNLMENVSIRYSFSMLWAQAYSKTVYHSSIAVRLNMPFTEFPTWVIHLPVHTFHFWNWIPMGSEPRLGKVNVTEEVPFRLGVSEMQSNHTAEAQARCLMTETNGPKSLFSSLCRGSNALEI